MSSPSEQAATGRHGWFPGWRSPATWVVILLLVVLLVVLAVRWSVGDGGTAAPASLPTASPGASQRPEPSVAPTEEPQAGAPGSPDVLRPTAAPVAIDEPAEPEPQVEVRLTSIEAVEGEANIPGEVGGPSLRVTVTIDNATSAALDLTSAVVNLYYGADRLPAIDLLEPGKVDFPGNVRAGETASGTFVFLIPVDERDDVTVEFDLSSDSTVLLFAGPVAT
ncbi:MAG TPA: hypothetical protein VFE45_10150 [Coriobacteriia bacterium]|nr:hypothetical protein [Coriobacteriia bacterium]